METTNRKGPIGKIILCGIGVLWLAGCYGPNAVELDYGNSVRNNMAQTILDPAAGLKNTPATGLSPTAAANEKELYEKAFKEEKKSEMKGGY